MAGSKTLDAQIAQAQKRVRELKRRKVERERAEIAEKWKALVEVFPQLDEADTSKVARWATYMKQIYDSQASGN